MLIGWQVGRNRAASDSRSWKTVKKLKRWSNKSSPNVAAAGGDALLRLVLKCWTQSATSVISWNPQQPFRCTFTAIPSLERVRRLLHRVVYTIRKTCSCFQKPPPACIAMCHMQQLKHCKNAQELQTQMYFLRIPKQPVARWDFFLIPIKAKQFKLNVILLSANYHKPFCLFVFCFR